jgi:formate/nitrite transporter
MRHFDFDAYTPAEMALRVETSGCSKAALNSVSMFVLAALAGAFIALGAIFYTFVVHDASLGLVPGRLLGGLVFCLGLILVVVGGAELFTGNNLIVMACAERKITIWQLLRNWSIVFIGNFSGALAMVGLIYFSGHWATDGLAAKVIMIANNKVNLSFSEALVRGILCNVLVCLAIWLCYAGHSVTDKILAILFPITAFVALGFEHSVANMYFIPAGLLLVDDLDVIMAAMPSAGQTIDVGRLTVQGFLVNNLLPVTIGNMIGGGLFVGAVYWFIYLRRSE